MSITFRFATVREVEVYYNWANDSLVRENSYSSDPIDYDKHVQWFNKKLLDKHCFLYYFEFNGQACGQVRIEQQTQETIVGISIDEWFRGKALAAQLLKLACADFLRRNKNETIIAYIKESNAGSYKAFIAANFSEINKLEVDGHSSFVMKKTYDEQL